MELLTINEALSQRGSKLLHAPYRDEKIIDESCPKCGSKLACVYGDFTSPDYFDNFAHLCLNPACDYMLLKEIWSTNPGGGRGEEQTYSKCIFCGRDIEGTL